MDATCAVTACPRRGRQRSGLCEMHYARKRRGQPLTARVCLSCAAPISPGRNSAVKYCSESCSPRCSIDGCSAVVKARSWCKTHFSRWQRTGTPDPAPMRPCSQCGQDLPTGSRKNRVFCGQRCANLAHYAKRPADERLAAHREWRNRTAPQRRAKLLAARVQKFCDWCGAPLPTACGNKRRFCDRKCTNKWSLRNRREIRHLNSHRYRARKRSESRLVTVGDWRKLCDRYGQKCAYCGSSGALTMDHVIPLIRGGRHSVGNLAPACQSCNSSKRDALLVEWRLGRRRTRSASRSYAC